MNLDQTRENNLKVNWIVAASLPQATIILILFLFFFLLPSIPSTAKGVVAF